MESGSHPQLADDKRTHNIKQVLWVVLALNGFVATLKIILGLWTRCMVIVVDGVHSLSDAASNIIGLVGVSMASHPADKSHPYGHRKFETIASFIISFSLFFAAITIAKQCLFKLFNPTQPEVNILSFSVMGLTLGVNGFTAFWEKKRGRELKSDLLIADSWHTFSDIFVTCSVLIALVGIRIGVPIFDSIISLGIAVFIGWIAVKILIRSSDVLSDRAMVDDQWVKDLVMRTNGVLDCHEIRSRGRPDDIRIDLHILVNSQMSVERSHQLANFIERDLRHNIKDVTDVLVHIEPSHHDHKELEAES